MYCACAKSLQLCPTLCDPVDCSPPGSSVHGIFPARLQEWVAISSSRESSQPRDQARFHVSCTGKRILYQWATLSMLYLVARSCPTLCDPVDCSPPGSSVHGIFPARLLEWVAMPSFRGSSQPRDQTFVSHIYLHWQADSSPRAPPAKPFLLKCIVEYC